MSQRYSIPRSNRSRFNIMVQKAILLLLYVAFTQFKSTIAAFTLGIRDSFMIAHSFHDHPSFGPAGGLHGATYTCDVEFQSDDLDEKCNWVIDIGKASELLANVLAKYNYKNLDEIFGDVLTTTEFMCRKVHQDLCELLKKEGVDFRGSICVKLWESHKAWASYSGSFDKPTKSLIHWWWLEDIQCILYYDMTVRTGERAVCSSQQLSAWTGQEGTQASSMLVARGTPLYENPGSFVGRVSGYVLCTRDS